MPAHQLAAMRHVGDICLALHRLPQPTIAKVRGVAVGAGANLALVCDLVVAGDTARFSEIFARRGLSIDFGGSWILPRVVGMHRAKELALLADIIDAERGRTTWASSTGCSPMPTSTRSSTTGPTELAAGPPIALAMTKRLLNNSFNVTLEEALDDEGSVADRQLRHQDTAEAVVAFMEKRAPSFPRAADR